MDDFLSLDGLVLNDKYRLLEKIAEGGMAVVYRAQHVFLEDFCAIKIIKKSLSDSKEMLDRFKREAKLTRRVARRNPHIIAIHDFGDEKGIGFFYVMELLNGRAFTEFIGEPDIPPPVEQSVRFMGQICEALAVVHEEGLVHRDIKPDNIFLHKEEHQDEEIVKLLDFGIARPTYAKATMLTNYGRVMGTPEYMSPEQCRGPTPQQYERGESHLDGRSDIYSLGVLLFQCLTGSLPFPMEVDGGPMAIHKVMAGHVMEEPPHPVELRPDLDISPRLSEITVKALAKSADDRFQTMAEFRSELNACFANISASNSKGRVIYKGQDISGLDTLPVFEVEEEPETVPAEEAVSSGLRLDQTAMDVQLPPHLLKQAMEWQPDNHVEDLSQPAPPLLPGWPGSMKTPVSTASDPDWSGGSHDSMSQTDNSYSFGEMREHSQTVTTPFEQGMLEQLREQAEQVLEEKRRVAESNEVSSPWEAGASEPEMVPSESGLDPANTVTSPLSPEVVQLLRDQAGIELSDDLVERANLNHWESDTVPFHKVTSKSSFWKWIILFLFLSVGGAVAFYYINYMM